MVTATVSSAPWFTFGRRHPGHGDCVDHLLLRGKTITPAQSSESVSVKPGAMRSKNIDIYDP